MNISEKIAYARLCDALAKNNHMSPQAKKELTGRAFDVLKSLDGILQAQPTGGKINGNNNQT